MTNDTKSTIKTVLIALLLAAVLGFGLYAIDSSNQHSHNGGEAHSH
jgi:hypothetical protein